MTTLQLLNPAGAAEITELHAPRLDTLNGKTIGVLSNDVWQSHRTLPLVSKLLKERYPESTVVPADGFITGMDAMNSEQTADLVQQKGWQAAVVGNAS